jgi:hypothetical protein
MPTPGPRSISPRPPLVAENRSLPARESTRRGHVSRAAELFYAGRARRKRRDRLARVSYTPIFVRAEPARRHPDVLPFFQPRANTRATVPGNRMLGSRRSDAWGRRVAGLLRALKLRRFATGPGNEGATRVLGHVVRRSFTLPAGQAPRAPGLLVRQLIPGAVAALARGTQRWRALQPTGALDVPAQRAPWSQQHPLVRSPATPTTGRRSEVVLSAGPGVLEALSRARHSVLVLRARG